MKETKDESSKWVLFGDGTLAKLMWSPIRKVNENGVPIIGLYLRTTERIRKKYQFTQWDYYDLDQLIIYREFAEATLMRLGQGKGRNPLFLEIEKSILNMSKQLENKTDKNLVEFKNKLEQLSKLMKLGGMSTGVFSLDEDPHAEFSWFCLTDLDCNETMASLFFSNILKTNDLLRQENKILDAKCRQLMDELRMSQENYMGYAKRMSDIVKESMKGKVIISNVKDPDPHRQRGGGEY